MLAISNISSISIISIITLFICWLSSTITGVYTSSQYQEPVQRQGHWACDLRALWEAATNWISQRHGWTSCLDVPSLYHRCNWNILKLMVHTNRFRSENNEDFLMSSQHFLFFFQYAWGLRCLFQLSWFGRSISNFPVFSPQVLQFPGCGTLGVPPVVPPVVLPVAPLRPPNLIQQQAMGGLVFFGSTNPQTA